jgi:hypothetical protein
MSASPGILSRKTSKDDLLQTQDLATPSSSTPNSPGRRNTLGSDPSIEHVSHTALNPPSRDGSPKIVLKRKEKTEATSKHTEEKVKHKASSRFEVPRISDPKLRKTSSKDFFTFSDSVQVPKSIINGSSTSLANVVLISEIAYLKKLLANLTSILCIEATNTIETQLYDSTNVQHIKSRIDATTEMVIRKVKPQLISSASQPSLDLFFTIIDPGIGEENVVKIKEILNKDFFRLLHVIIEPDGFVSMDKETTHHLAKTLHVHPREFQKIEQAMHESKAIENQLQVLEEAIKEKYEKLKEENQAKHKKNTPEAIEIAFSDELYISTGHQKLDAANRENFIRQGVQLLTQDEFKKIMLPHLSSEIPKPIQDFLDELYVEELKIDELGKSITKPTPISLKTARELLVDIKNKILEKIKTGKTPPKIPFGPDTIEVVVLQALHLDILSNAELKKIFEKHKIKFHTDIPPIQEILKKLNPNYPYKRLLLDFKIAIYERFLEMDPEKVKNRIGHPLDFQAPIRSIIADAGCILKLKAKNRIFTTHQTPLRQQTEILQGRTPTQVNSFANHYLSAVNKKTSALKDLAVFLFKYIESQTTMIDVLLAKGSEIHRLVHAKSWRNEEGATYLRDLRSRVIEVMVENYLDSIFVSVGRELLKIKEEQLKRPFLGEHVLKAFQTSVTEVDTRRTNVLKNFLAYVGKGLIGVIGKRTLKLPPLIEDPNFPNLNISIWIENALTVFGNFFCNNDSFLKDLTRFITVFAKYIQENNMDLDQKLTEEHASAFISIMVKTLHHLDSEQEKLKSKLQTGKPEDKAFLEEATGKVLIEHADNYMFLEKILEEKKCLPEEIKGLISLILIKYKPEYKQVLADYDLDQILSALMLLYRTPIKNNVLEPLRSITDGMRFVFDHDSSDPTTALNFGIPEDNESELFLGKGEFILVQLLKNSSKGNSIIIKWLKDVSQSNTSPRGDRKARSGFLEEVSIQIPTSGLTTAKMALSEEDVSAQLKLHFKVPSDGSWETDPTALAYMRKLRLYLEMAQFKEKLQVIEIDRHQSFSESSDSTETDTED